MSKRNIVDELHKPARRNFKRRRVIIKGLDELWQADLVEMGVYSSENDNYHYLLTVIDAFSKFAWTVPLKSKSGMDVTAAMQSILKGNRTPKNLQTDDGKEFYNKFFLNLMKKYQINQYSTFSALKTSIVERFNRTFKNKMWKEFSTNGSFRWIDMIKSLTETFIIQFIAQ